MTTAQQDVAAWPRPATFAEFERALDSGRLYAAMQDGRFWKARRNGRTQTWKRDASRREVPIKCGLRACARVASYGFQPENWRVVPD